MNERYLCKGKDKDDGRWYQGYYLLLHDTTYCSMPSDNVEETKRFDEENTHHYIVFERMTDWGLPNKHLRAEILTETLCRCTGLKDKNKKLIWENDIVRYTDMITGAEKIVRIEWNETHASFTRLYKSKMGLQYLNFDEFIASGCEVIGSAIDNPELLEVEHE